MEGRIMRKLLGMLVVGFCTTMAHGAVKPEICIESGLPLKYQQPFEDLSGKLPVADYLDVVVACSDIMSLATPGGPPPPKVVSAWLDADAKRYTELLSHQKTSLLVLPAQTQYYGFDRIERSLIGAEVAAAFAGPDPMPDTLLVARALGEVRRRFDSVSLGALTTAVGAKRRVDTFVGHDGTHHMTLTIQLQECNEFAICKLIKQRDWRALAFSDTQPAFRVVNGLRAEIRREFLGAGAASGKPPARAAAPKLLDTPLAQLFASNTADARTASLIASLSPSGDVLARERLSLLALREWLRDSAAADSHFFAAYAAMDLQRRPYALALLGKHEDPAAHVLRELLNGNLDEAKQGLGAVKTPLVRLMLAFKIQDLLQTYGGDADFDPSLATAVFGSALKEWEPLVERRVGDLDSWARTDPAAVKVVLDVLAPAPGLALKDLLVGSAVVSSDAATETGIGVASFRHLAKALGTMHPGECCSAATRGAVRWQWLWLIEGLTQANVFKDMERMNERQGLPKSALEAAQKFDNYLEGHPDFELARARALAAQGRLAANDEARRFETAYDKSEAIATYWSQGQSPTSAQLVFRGATRALADAYTHDFPRRGYWPPITSKGAAGQCEALNYSVADPSQALGCIQESDAAAKPRLNAELNGRFHGHPRRDTWLGLTPSPSQTAGRIDYPSQIARLRAEVKAKPDEWLNYEGLGTMLIHANGDYAEAQRVFLSYPGFKSGKGNAVGLTNSAYESGSELYWRGQPELARPLYQIASDLQTGSDSAYSAEARLAQLDGDYESAAEIMLMRASRYADGYAYRDYLALLSAMGHGDEARTAFLQVAEVSDLPQAWVGSMVDQRMASMRYDQMASWVLSDSIRGAHYRGRRFAAWYAILWATSDRKPPAGFPKLVEQIERDAVRTIDSGMVSRPHAQSENSFEIVRASQFRAGKAARLPEGTHVKSEYVLLADALTSLYAEQYAMAVDKFLALADLYAIDDNMQMKYALPFLAMAAAKSGDKAGIEAVTEAIPWKDQDFEAQLSRAFFAAVRHDSDKAEAALKRAFNVRPHTDYRPILTEYQFIEACEFVARETKDPRFERMAVDWARRHQKIAPTMAWGYTVDAQYSPASPEADRALALALYLDPLSPRLAKISAARRDAARAWLKANNPFLPAKATRPTERVTQMWSAPPAP
jgi:hypothetical protein